MFVRWRSYQLCMGVKHNNPNVNNIGTSYAAYLCKSERVNGKVKKRDIAYLGSIKHRNDKEWVYIHNRNSWYDDHACHHFYINAIAKLRTLELTGEQRSAIIKQLTSIVPNK